MDARNEQFNSGKAAIGTGPYKFVSWEPKGDLVLERVRRLLGRSSPGRTSSARRSRTIRPRMAALKSGQVDLVNYVPGDRLCGDAEGQVARHLRRRLRLLPQHHAQREGNPAGQGRRSMARRSTPTRFRDPKVREAMDLAIDRKTLVARRARRPGQPGQPADAGHFLRRHKNCRSVPTMSQRPKRFWPMPAIRRASRSTSPAPTTACRATPQSARRSRRCGRAPASRSTPTRSTAPCSSRPSRRASSASG